MLLANRSVAERIYNAFPTLALLRRHPTPPESRFERLIRAAASVGVKINASTSRALATSLDAAVLPENPAFNTVLRILTTRCMTQAKYFCTGDVSVSDFGHYGLATPMYTHFTSPIRR